MLPARNHAVVLVSKVHLPTLRALAYAQATRPDTLTAVTVNVDDKDTRALQAEWERREMPVPLTVIDSPYREITRPILDFVKRVRRDSPRDVVTVFIPEYVVGRWWENLLHNQSALRLKGRLLFEPGVMVTSVPWQLASSQSRDLDRLDATLIRGPARGPRTGARSSSTRRACRARAVPRRVTRSHRRPDDGDVPAPTSAGQVMTDGPDRAAVAEEERVTLTVGAAGARRALRRPARRPGGLRPARAARRAGRRAWSPRCTADSAGRRGRGARAVAGPGRAALPVRRTRPLRRLRPAARGPGGAASTEDRGGPRAADPARQADGRRRSTRSASRSRRCPAAQPAGAPGSATRSTPPAGPGCSSTARTRSCRSTAA